MRRFASDASVRVALLSVTAAGVGLDFSSASVVVFAGGQAMISLQWDGHVARLASKCAVRLAVQQVTCSKFRTCRGLPVS